MLGPMFGSRYCKAHQVHITLSEPMTSIVQQGSSLGFTPTPLPSTPTIIDLRVIDLVSSLVWWEAVTNPVGRVRWYTDLVRCVLVPMAVGRGRLTWVREAGIHVGRAKTSILEPQGAIPPGSSLPWRAKFITWRLRCFFLWECRRGPMYFWSCWACLGNSPEPRPT